MMVYHQPRALQLNVYLSYAALLVICLIIPFIFLIVLYNNNTIDDSPAIRTIKGELIVTFNGFNVSFNHSINLPNYTVYKLSQVGSSCGVKKFNSTAETFTHDDFNHLDYDRGHMVPKNDINSCATMTMMNVAPQLQCFNRGIWSQLEKYIRANYMFHDIVTAPKYDLNNFIVTRTNKTLYIPIGFYKVVMKNNKVVFKIYISHKYCYRYFLDVGDQTKLPFFMKE